MFTECANVGCKIGDKVNWGLLLGLFIACVDINMSQSWETERESDNKGSEIKKGGIPL